LSRLPPLEPLQSPGNAAVHRRSPAVTQRDGVGEHISLSFLCQFR
jgi:hypothetical protein